MKLKLLFVLFFIYSSVSGSTPPEKKDELVYKYLHLAKQYNKQGNFSKSLHYYQKLDSLIPEAPEIKYEIGACYLYLKHAKKALPFLEFAKEKDLEFEELYYTLGQAYHQNHLFDKAIVSFQQYIKDLSLDSANIDSFMIKKTLREIEICGFAKEIIQDSVLVEIENLGNHINTAYDEYVPIVAADQHIMFFTSRRPSIHNKVSKDGKFFEDIYSTAVDKNGKWGSAKLVNHPLNDGQHDACIGMTADAHTIFTYKIHTSDPTKGNIFVSKLQGSVWSTPKKIGSKINTKKGWEASLSISEDNHRLYFSSNKEGGFGGMDIWYSDLLPNNEWGEPINMGSNINTKYDEDCPFIHFDDRTMFFSSNGHKTMGGFDVFSTVFNTKENAWSVPRNIGYPINSADDDMYFVYSADGSKGYLSSAIRPGGLGGEDLYSVHRPNHSKTMISLSGNILDENSAPLEATITVTDLELNKIMTVQHSNSETGKYVLALDYGKNYYVQIECKNHLFVSENINVSNPEVIFSDRKNFVMKSLKVGNSLVLNNLFYEYKKVKLKNESLPELDRLLEFMKFHPNVYIEVASHTDSVGSDAFNYDLSLKRALDVRNYLSARGIAKKNIKMKAYGETRPIAPNSTLEGRNRNRRTECLIVNIDSVSSDDLYKIAKLDTIGDETIALHAVLQKEKIGEILIPKIYFAYNEGYYMSENSKLELENVFAAMKRIPKLSLEIVSHIDVVGAEFKNKSLFDKRAHTVLNYLKDKGVKESRLSIRPYISTDYKKQLNVNYESLENRKVEFVLKGF